MKKIDQLVELASETGLDATSDMLASFSLPALFDGVDAVSLEAPAEDLSTLLQQCTRRGLEPALVGELLGHFEGKPLEQGLIAWDTLAQSIWPQDEDEIFARLQACIAKVKEFRPSGIDLGIDLQKYPAATLVAQHAPFEGSSIVEGLKNLDLAAIVAAINGGGKEATLVRSDALASALTSMGRLLALGHLPTLASVYLDLAARALNHRPAAIELLDVMFDVRAAARLPEDGVRKGDVPDTELSDLLEYVLYRTKINLGESLNAYAVFKTNLERRGDRPMSERLATVWTDLAMQIRDGGPPLRLLDDACDHHELWQYAWRMRAARAAFLLDAGSDSLRPFELCADFTSRFGNNWRCWYDVFQAVEGPAPYKLQSCGFLGREVLTLPHDYQAWKSLIVLVAPDPETILSCTNEIEDQLMGQTEWEDD